MDKKTTTVGGFAPTKQTEAGSIDVDWAGGKGQVRVNNLPAGAGSAIESALRDVLGGNVGSGTGETGPRLVTEKDPCLGGGAPLRVGLLPFAGGLDSVIGKVFGDLLGERSADPTTDKGVELIAKYLDSHADTVPTDPEEARKLGEAAGAFAASALRGFKQGMRWTPTADDLAAKMPSREDLIGAIARAWTTEANAGKEMDAELAAAAVDEVLKLFGKRD